MATAWWRLSYFWIIILILSLVSLKFFRHYWIWSVVRFRGKFACHNFQGKRCAFAFCSKFQSEICVGAIIFILKKVLHLGKPKQSRLELCDFQFGSSHFPWFSMEVPIFTLNWVIKIYQNMSKCLQTFTSTLSFCIPWNVHINPIVVNWGCKLRVR